MLTCIGSEAHVTSPVTGVHKYDVWVDVCSTRSAANNDGWINDRTLLMENKQQKVPLLLACLFRQSNTHAI